MKYHVLKFDLCWPPVTFNLLTSEVDNFIPLTGE